MGFDLGKVISDAGQSIGDAANALGQAVTHPADDIGTLGQILSHPADDVNALGNFVSNAAKPWASAFSKLNIDIPDLVQKLANTDIGKEVLSVATGAVYVTLVPIVGPIALATFAAPGLLQGQKDIGQAWLSGFMGQAQRAVKALTNGNADLNVLPPDVQDQVASLTTTISQQTAQASNFLQSIPGAAALAKQFGVPDLAHISPEMIASKLGIRVDTAAAALANYASKQGDKSAISKYINTNFNGTTGARMVDFVADAKTYERAGQALEQQDPVILAGATLSADPNWRQGFDVAVGMSQQPLAPSDFTAMQNFLQTKGVSLSITTPSAPTGGGPAAHGEYDAQVLMQDGSYQYIPNENFHTVPVGVEPMPQAGPAGQAGQPHKKHKKHRRPHGAGAPSAAAPIPLPINTPASHGDFTTTSLFGDDDDGGGLGDMLSSAQGAVSGAQGQAQGLLSSAQGAIPSGAGGLLSSAQSALGGGGGGGGGRGAASGARTTSGLSSAKKGTATVSPRAPSSSGSLPFPKPLGPGQTPSAAQQAANNTSVTGFQAGLALITGGKIPGAQAVVGSAAVTPHAKAAHLITHSLLAGHFATKLTPIVAVIKANPQAKAGAVAAVKQAAAQVVEKKSWWSEFVDWLGL